SEYLILQGCHLGKQCLISGQTYVTPALLDQYSNPYSNDRSCVMGLLARRAMHGRQRSSL
ncbi:hypothetical protein, partial [Streptosporangium sp. NPDC006007]|uniref:hypothetical protein n=1 Tax=Streptosporangium sp. NPDC006007 TaxID=3154575 RepID=UPI0033A826EE